MRIRLKAIRRKSEEGQSFVELALGMVLFLFFVMGVLDLGRLYFYYVAMEDSAGEAALYLALNADCPGPPGDPVCSSIVGGCKADCADPNNAKYRASHASSLVDLSTPGSSLSFQFLPKTSTSEDMVTVKIEYPFELLTPVISRMVSGGKLTLTSKASQVLLSY
jgi:hypothetical protein